MKPGYVDGKHFTRYIDTVKELKRKGEYDRAINLLLKLVEATEDESRVEGFGVAPWYYEQLAIIYKKIRDKDNEIKILERFTKQKHAPGVTPGKLYERLNKLLEERK